MLSSYLCLKTNHRRLIRALHRQDCSDRDNVLNSISSSDPSVAYKAIKCLNRNKIPKISKLRVGSHTFYGDDVPDGIYSSIKELKTNLDASNHDCSAIDFDVEYQVILEICQSGQTIPPLSRTKTEKILRLMKKDVNDVFSIAAAHFLYAGDDGVDHFHLILNAIITNINLAGASELNSIYASVLHKGH